MPSVKKHKKSNKWLVPGIIVIIAVIAAVLIFNQGGKSETLPANISVSEAATRFEEGAFLLDVRQPDEWVQGHVEGAVLIPLGELETRIDEIPVDRDVLIICRSGNRSSQARDILRSAGFDQTTSIMGGINAWTAAGLPVITGE